MNKILIKNGNLITMDETKNPIEKNMDILIENNKIKKVGKSIELKEPVKVIDATNQIVMPGLVNTHAHLAMSLFKETSDGYTLQEWLTNVAWPIEAKMTEEDIYVLTYLSCIEMIKTGTTTVSNHYFMTENAIKAELDCHMNVLETRVLMDHDEHGDERLDELETLITKYVDNSQIKLCVGIHGLYTSSPAYLEKAVQLANQYQLPIHIHFCENEQEVEDIKQIYQVKNPAQVLQRYFANNHLMLAHCVKLEKQDIEIMNKLDVSVLHCPVSNVRLGCGVANIKEYLDHGINVCLGTDGQGSGSNLDMFEAMRLAALLQKVKYENPNVIASYDILKMATINGARALGMENRGKIAEGNIADLIILELDHDVHTTPIHDVLSDIIYNASGHNVVTSMINGKIVMENRKLISSIQEEKIRQAYLTIAKRLFASN